MNWFRERLNDRSHRRAMERWIRRQWEAPAVTEWDIVLRSDVQLYCQDLLPCIRATIDTRSPQQIGTLLSVIHQATLGIAILMVQAPREDQSREYFGEIHSHCSQRLHSFGIGWENLFAFDIAACLESLRARFRQIDPTHDDMAAFLLPIATEQAIHQAGIWNERFITALMEKLFDEIRQQLHERLSESQFRQLRKTYCREQLENTEFPNPSISQLQGDLQDDVEDWELDQDIVDGVMIPGGELFVVEFRPTGDPIERSAFCKSPMLVPEGTECVICAGEDEDWVVTDCNHFYHAGCLNDWVNESAAPRRNECPLCRTQMCEARPRVPVVQLNTHDNAEM